MSGVSPTSNTTSQDNSPSLNHSLQPQIQSDDSTPWFVIRGDECCLAWLIKQICLIFQCCVSQETINRHIASFSDANIRWLTQAQIEGLPDESIRQLGVEQLNALTFEQYNYFLNSQQHALSETILRAEQQTTQIQTNNPTYRTTNSQTNNEIAPQTSTRRSLSSQNTALPIVDNSHAIEQRLSRTKLLDYFNNPSVKSTMDAYLPTEDKQFLESPLVKSFVESHAERFLYYNLTNTNIGYLKTSLLNSFTVFQFVDEEDENPIESENKELLLSCLSEEDAALLSDVERIKNLADWKEKCKLILLSKNLQLLRFMVEPEDQLLALSVAQISNITDNDTISYLSLKLNCWLEDESFSFWDRFHMKRGFEENWGGLWETLRRKGVDLSTSLIVLPPSDKQKKEQERAALFNAILSFQHTITKIQDPNNADPVMHYTSESITLDPDLEKRLVTLESFEQLNSSQFSNLSSTKLSQFNRTLSALLHEALRPEHEVNEATVNAENIKTLTLEQFRYLSAEKINSLIASLPPVLVTILSKKQLQGLNTSLLNAAQVTALFSNVFSGLSDVSRCEKILDILSPQQIRAMQDKLSGNLLQKLSTTQTQALDAGALTQTQVNEFINWAHFTRSTLLAKFTTTQIPALQNKLSGNFLGDLTTPQTQALNAGALTQMQVDDMINWIYSTTRTELLAKFTTTQIPALQNKLSGDSLGDLTVPQTQALDAGALTQTQVDDFINRAYSTTRPTLLAKLDPQQVRAMQRKLSGNSICDLTKPQTQSLIVDSSSLNDNQLRELFSSYSGRGQLLEKFTPDQQDVLRPRLSGLSIRID